MNPGRLVFPALRADADGGFTQEAETIRTGLDVGAGGFIIFGGNAASVRMLATDLHGLAKKTLEPMLERREDSTAMLQIGRAHV